MRWAPQADCDSPSKSKPPAAKAEAKKEKGDRVGCGKEEAQREAAASQRAAKREMAVMAQTLVVDLVNMIEEGDMLKGAVCSGAGNLVPWSGKRRSFIVAGVSARAREPRVSHGCCGQHVQRLDRCVGVGVNLMDLRLCIVSVSVSRRPYPSFL